MKVLIKNPLKDKRLAAILIAFFALLYSTPEADAHAGLVRSQPAGGEILRQSPKAIELTFNAALQTGSMNSIVVTDQNGSRVDKNKTVVSEDGKKLLNELEELFSGVYTVEWKALSADDHSIKGEFSFKVSLSGDKNPVSEQMPKQPSNDQSAMTRQTTMTQESGANWTQSVARWLTYLAMMTLFGGFAFQLLVLKPSFRNARELSGEDRILGLKQAENRFFRLIWLSLALLAVIAPVSLILQTSAVFETSFAQAFAPSRLFEVLSETSYGLPWLLQVAAVLILFAAGVFLPRVRQQDKSGQTALSGRAAFLWTGFAVSAALLLAPSLSGHARAAEAEYRFAVFSDWLHLAAAGIWVGGLFQMALTVPKSIGHLTGEQRLGVLARVIPLFSRLAVAATILIALTGIYNSWIHLNGFSDLWRAPYGITLLIKIVLFLPMLALGAFNTFVLRPRAERLTSEAVSDNDYLNTAAKFYRTVKIEAALGAVVLLLAAILAFLPPPQRHQMPAASVENNRVGFKAK